MDAMQELMSQTCGQIAEAFKSLQDDLERIREREKDWMYRDFEIKVRWARYTLETADLERQRMMMLRALAVAGMQNPIIVMDTN